MGLVFYFGYIEILRFRVNYDLVLGFLFVKLR